MEKRSFTGFVASLCCFVALGVSAVVAFITYLLPLVTDITIGDSVMNNLELVFKFSALIGLGCGALSFAANRGLITKILCGLFILVFIVSIILQIVGVL